jgi:hypothetical protein
MSIFHRHHRVEARLRGGAVGVVERVDEDARRDLPDTPHCPCTAAALSWPPLPRSRSTGGRLGLVVGRDLERNASTA